MQRDENYNKEYHLKWFDIVMEEYNSLRNESSDALKHQQSIINYGLTTIGVFIAFSASLWGENHIVESIYVLFIPFMCNLIMLIWNGEVRRMSRAGQYIKILEDKLHRELSGKLSTESRALEWETYLRRPKEVAKRETTERNGIQILLNKTEKFFLFLLKKEKDNNKIKSNYIAIIFMFGGVSTFSILLGYGHNFSMFSGGSDLGGVKLLQNWFINELWQNIVYSFTLLVNLAFFVYHYRYFQKVKK